MLTKEYPLARQFYVAEFSQEPWEGHAYFIDWKTEA